MRTVGQGHNTALPPFSVTCAAVSAFGLGAAGAFEPRAEKLNRSTNKANTCGPKPASAVKQERSPPGEATADFLQSIAFLPGIGGEPPLLSPTLIAEWMGVSTLVNGQCLPPATGSSTSEPAIALGGNSSRKAGRQRDPRDQAAWTRSCRLICPCRYLSLMLKFVSLQRILAM